MTGVGLVLAVTVAECAPLQVRVDKRIDIPVQHLLRVRLFFVRTKVLDQLVGLQEIRTDLIAPGNLRHLAPDVIQLFRVLLLLEHVQLDLQFLEGLVLVLELRTFILARHDDTGREVRNTDGGRSC